MRRLSSKPARDIADYVVELAAALVVHDYGRHAPIRCQGGERRVVAEAPDVVDEVRAGV